MPKRKKHPRRLKTGDGQRLRFQRVLDEDGVIKDRIVVEDRDGRLVADDPNAGTDEEMPYGR